MGTVRDLMKRLENCDVDKIARDAMTDSKLDLIEWQQEQLSVGKNAKGGFIKPPYKPYTVRIKKKKGQRYDVVTLRDTGDFYKAIFVDVRSTTYVIDSHDYKAPKLLNKYGQSIFGLGGVFMVGFRHDLRPRFNRHMSNALKLKFG